MQKIMRFKSDWDLNKINKQLEDGWNVNEVIVGKEEYVVVLDKAGRKEKLKQINKISKNE